MNVSLHTISMKIFLGLLYEIVEKFKKSCFTSTPSVYGGGEWNEQCEKWNFKYYLDNFSPHFAHLRYGMMIT